MGATAHADSALAESNGNNNQNTTPFTVTAVQQLPDLMISSILVRSSRGNPGWSAVVAVTVNNNAASSAASTLSLHDALPISTITTSDPLLDTFTAGALAAGQSATYTRTVTIPSGQ